MSKARASPTARLFQTSRLFSLPKALPKPARHELSANGLERYSDTATSIYPTHQAIDCPHSSRVIGEWGLKRHLPSKTTTKNASPIRVLAQDTNDHVTDFASAGDHSISLEKFQELGIPILRRPTKASARRQVSVYEDVLDTTNRAHGSLRWRHTGPWLLEMSVADLDKFLVELKARRPEWINYLREYFAQRDFEAAKKGAVEDKGFFGPVELQNLSLQRDYIVQNAEEQVRALQSAHTGESTPELERECQQIMTTAQRKADQCEVELERQTQHMAAINILQTEDQRAANIVDFAKQRMTRQASKNLHEDAEDPDQAASIEPQYAEAKEDADDVLRNAYEDVISRFGETPSTRDLAALETHARRLTSEAQSAIAASEQARVERLEQWEEEQRQGYYPDDTKLEALQKELRDAHARQHIRSELTTTIAHFLDLPGIPDYSSPGARKDKAASMARTSGLQEQLLKHGFMTSTEKHTGRIPLSTHPGAGLGYLRSSAHMDNHPIYGPQAQRSAVLARVVRPRTSAGLGTGYSAKIGIAGFVADDPKGSQVNRSLNLLNGNPDDPERMAVAIDPYRPGGNKMYMHATSALVTEAGQINIRMVRSEKEAIAVKTGNVQAILDDKKATLAGSSASRMGISDSMFGIDRGPQRRYGAGSSEYGRP